MAIYSRLAILLVPYAQYRGDRMMPQGCITVNPEVNRDSSGPICTSAGILVDTGIPQSYVTLPLAIQFYTVEQTDLSEPTKTVKVLAPKTSVAVNIPNAVDPVAIDAFIVGAGAPNEPAQVIPSSTEPPPPAPRKAPFIDTGRPFSAAVPVPVRRQARLCRHEEPAVRLRRAVTGWRSASPGGPHCWKMLPNRCH